MANAVVHAACHSVASLDAEFPNVGSSHDLRQHTQDLCCVQQGAETQREDCLRCLPASNGARVGVPKSAIGKMEASPHVRGFNRCERCHNPRHRSPSSSQPTEVKGNSLKQATANGNSAELTATLQCVQSSRVSGMSLRAIHMSRERRAVRTPATKLPHLKKRIDKARLIGRRQRKK